MAPKRGHGGLKKAAREINNLVVYGVLPDRATDGVALDG
jgi:hypothetical protein